MTYVTAQIFLKIHGLLEKQKLAKSDPLVL